MPVVAEQEPRVSPAPGLVPASAAAAATHVTTWLRRIQGSRDGPVGQHAMLLHHACDVITPLNPQIRILHFNILMRIPDVTARSKIHLHRKCLVWFEII